MASLYNGSDGPSQPTGPKSMPTIREGGETHQDVPDIFIESTNAPSFSSDVTTAITSATSRPVHRRNLTVDKKWKVEEQIAYVESKLGKASAWTQVLKWMATVIFGVGILGLFVYTRLCFISLAWMYGHSADPNNGESNDTQTVHKTGHFLVLYLLMTIPYTVLLLRACWMGLFTRQAPWPRRSAVFWCIITGTLEPLGLIMMGLKVVPKLEWSLSVLSTGCTSLLPVLAAGGWSATKGQAKGQKLCGFLSLPVMITGVGLVIYLLEASHELDDWKLRAHTLAALVALNLAWFPQIRSWCVKSSQVIDDKTSSKTHSVSTTNSLPRGSSASSSASSSPSRPAAYNTISAIEAVNEQFASNSRGGRNRRLYKRATWKASVVIYLTKLVASLVILFVFYYIERDEGDIRDSFTSESFETFKKAWDFSSSIDHQRETWTAFGINLAGAFVCYIMAFIVCHTNMHIGGLLVPLFLSLPLSAIIVRVDGGCEALLGSIAVDCGEAHANEGLVILASVLLSVGQLLAFCHMTLPIEQVQLQKEGELFFIPGYQAAIMDCNILLNKRSGKENSVKVDRSFSKTRIYICTTMYREVESEMRQLLESLARINVAQADIDHFFESHIVLDGGVVDKNLSDFALQLISLLEETLGIKPSHCTKIKTPYGLKLNWELPTRNPRKQKMTFSIHLKDNTKVKNKKRWSQIMYMSYVLDFLTETAQPDEECYILTTDADVMFTAQSVEALLDLMQRDNTIGAVCARTHPMGIGPLVWYQTFEYAVGHWLQKATEHVLGSVLCAPGCFSVYRCTALRDIVPKYCKKVKSAFDFLTKDMGEDRWLCTLMVQSGWRIEYCAASENSTNCPSEFEEFYKQRRRWIASTLANIMLIIREWKYVALFNQRVSVVFLIYQALLLFSTLIGPSTVILVVSGGLTYSWNVDTVTSLILQIIISILFAMACVFMSSKNHLRLAKAYTFLYATLMCAVVVGTAVQIANDLDPPSPKTDNTPRRNDSQPTTTMNVPNQPNDLNPRGNYSQSTITMTVPDQHISVDIPVSVTSLYFAFLAGMFLLAGLLHPRELYCLFHSLWYLLCLPSAYLVLMIYSICNLTDSSWGTREGTMNEAVVKKEPWFEAFKRGFYHVFFCCTPPDYAQHGKGVDIAVQTVMPYNRQSSASMSYLSEDGASMRYGAGTLSYGEDNIRSASEHSFLDVPYQTLDFEAHREEDEFQEDNEPVQVEEWLPHEFRDKYAEIFKRYGFNNTLFIKSMTEKDLNRMGIAMRGHVQYLLARIAEIPAFEIEEKIPSNAKQWLEDIGLSMYISNFRRNRIQTAREMEILKRFDRKDIEKELGITKEGHIKRLMYGIRMLKEPTEGQLKIMAMRQIIEDTPIHNLSDFDVAEYEFWNQLKEKCLQPDLKAFGIDGEIRVKLVELRNNWLMIMGVSNILWLILITTLASRGELTVIGANALGLVFLIIYSLIFIIQFLCMLVHRLSTMSHYLARASYSSNKPPNTQWSFKDSIVHLEDSMQADVNQVKVEALHRANMKSRIKKKKSSNSNVVPTERSPLL